MSVKLESPSCVCPHATHDTKLSQIFPITLPRFQQLATMGERKTKIENEIVNQTKTKKNIKCLGKE
ncbi:minor histocompatibility antigen H13 isoform X2 [Sesbania bispinosa]|nr:minor histocompatibility antigen H13 isoform X2 [Sesbania bispinosa]